MQSLKSILVIMACVFVGAESILAEEDAVTDVVVLGVAHAAMLVAEPYRPAVFRAFIDHVNPDAICVERPPEEFARGSHYEFTYEIQDLAVPFAREAGMDLCPFDWIPESEDQILAFGVVLQDLPFVRGPRTYANFLTYPDSSALSRDLFFAETEAEREEHRDWYRTVPKKARHDFARRLFLYRTFLQTMRVSEAAAAHRGGRILVIVGAMHKDDMEQILKDEPGIRVVSPAQFGQPTPAKVATYIRPTDLAAIATFNLFGAQAQTENVDWNWLHRVINRLQTNRPGAESQLFATRLGVLTGRIEPTEAIEQYRAIQTDAGPDARFTWTGVLDSRRIDSFADPFGNLTVAQRAMLEEARELLKLGSGEAAVSVREALEAALSPLKAAQLRAYWSEWVEDAR